MKTTVEITLHLVSSSYYHMLFLLYYVDRLTAAGIKKRQLGRNNSLRVKELPFSARKYFHKIWTD